VLFVTVFAPDEPVEQALEAARATPEFDYRFTGDERRCPPAVRSSAPPNVSFTGFLRGAEYQRALLDAHVVLVLTTTSTSVVRAGYEAVYAGRPLVISDHPILREVFGHAIFVDGAAESIARGVTEAVERREELLARAGEALRLQNERWDAQLAAIRSRLEPARAQ
jgi:glycosyltransferase involved in cell wall biosynthesis